MLSQKEKEEFLEDGLSQGRRKEFSKGKKADQRNSRSLDDFLDFLSSIQRIFSPFAPSRKETIAKFNKL